MRLMCLVADKNIEAAISQILKSRRPSLNLPDFHHEVLTHNNRDPGCYHEGPEFLQNLLKTEEYRGLLVFDQAWEGNPHATATETENAIRQRFLQLGIADDAEVVVIEPEIEAWVWSNSPHVLRELGWNGNYTSLRNWLEDKGLWPNNSLKPPDPKKAVETVLRENYIPRSSAIYRNIAAKVSLARCQDDSFRRLRRCLLKLCGYR